MKYQDKQNHLSMAYDGADYQPCEWLSVTTGRRINDAKWRMWKGHNRNSTDVFLAMFGIKARRVG